MHSEWVLGVRNIDSCANVTEMLIYFVYLFNRNLGAFKYL